VANCLAHGGFLSVRTKSCDVSSALEGCPVSELQQEGEPGMNRLSRERFMLKAFSPSNVSLAVRSLLLQRKGRSSDTMPREKNVNDEPRPELVWWVVELGFRRTLPKTRSNRALGSSLTPLHPATGLCLFAQPLRSDPSGARLERSWKLHSAFCAVLCLREMLCK